MYPGTLGGPNRANKRAKYCSFLAFLTHLWPITLRNRLCSHSILLLWLYVAACNEPWDPVTLGVTNCVDKRTKIL